MDRIFRNRAQAGRLLGKAVSRRLGNASAIVLGLPRGGVPVAVAVARVLGAPVDALIVRKVGVPGHRELAMGAIAAGGVTVRNEELLAAFPGAARQFDAVAREERAELERRELAYRGQRGPLVLKDRTAVLVDDGVATGATLRAAIAAARQLGAARVVVAAPVASGEALSVLAVEADDVICLEASPTFLAVGQWYRDFPQVTDEEVRDLLAPA